MIIFKAHPNATRLVRIRLNQLTGCGFISGCLLASAYLLYSSTLRTRRTIEETRNKTWKKLIMAGLVLVTVKLHF